MPDTRQGMTTDAIEELIAQRVADALATYETNQNTRNCNGNGSGSQSDGKSGSRRTVHTGRRCTYNEFLNCQPHNFKSTKGVIGLARWFEKMEFVFHISNCAVECHVKYVTCTLLNGALTWWNSHVRIVGYDAAYEMSWKGLMKMMTEAYCPKNKIQKLESELWNLTVKGTDVGNVTSAGLKRLQDAVKLANSLMDKKVRAYVARQIETKRRLENNPRDNQEQKPPYKTQNVERAYTAGPSEKSGYAGHYRSECLKLKNQNRGNGLELVKPGEGFML
ncbi:reverse transcriptase domain-containing protein [Tanacetum coccineum]